MVKNGMSSINNLSKQTQNNSDTLVIISRNGASLV